ncbi:hypothetical protein E2562_022998 [Oryza meyeriana var. granulata]|uniref:Uncharacterized protein n=1 Tax=Oryza meyeriana var. granulata TaxID=110450 RepID=A0A6G1EYB4_9ORYZ|nr:hypothetical protein E2562_022998 [Oryza meyeriana var. granulata]
MRGVTIQSTHGLVYVPPGAAVVLVPWPRPASGGGPLHHHGLIYAPPGAAIALVPWPRRAGGRGPFHHHGLVCVPPGATVALRSDLPPPRFLPCQARSPSLSEP